MVSICMVQCHTHPQAKLLYTWSLANVRTIVCMLSYHLSETEVTMKRFWYHFEKETQGPEMSNELMANHDILDV